MTASAPDPEIIRESYEAVKYEIKMLADHCFIKVNLMENLQEDLIKGGSTATKVPPEYLFYSIDNGSLELILLHMRTLNEFFRKGSKQRREKDIFAIDYFDFPGAETNVLGKDIEDLISRTLGHITSERLNKPRWNWVEYATKMLQHSQDFLKHVKSKIDEKDLPQWDRRESTETDKLIRFIEVILNGSPTGFQASDSESEDLEGKKKSDASKPNPDIQEDPGAEMRYQVFKDRYNEEKEREKTLQGKASGVFAILSFILGASIIDGSDFIVNVDQPLALTNVVLGILVLALIISLVLFIRITSIYKYQTFLSPIHHYREMTSEPTITRDSLFLQRSTARVAAATEHNLKVNTAIATKLWWTSVFVLIAIVMILALKFQVGAP